MLDSGIKFGHVTSDLIVLPSEVRYASDRLILEKCNEKIASV